MDSVNTNWDLELGKMWMQEFQFWKCKVGDNQEIVPGGYESKVQGRDFWLRKYKFGSFQCKDSTLGMRLDTLAKVTGTDRAGPISSWYTSTLKDQGSKKS